MNYLVIDLEMCKVPKNYRGKNYKYASEIIQVGAVLLDEEYKEIGTLCQYVHPEFGILDYFITNLTGIEKGQIKNAPKLKDALIHMADWLGEREYKVFAWSKSDYWQLDHEIKSKKLNDEKLDELMKPERWVDYQEIFGKKYNFEQAVGLQEALMHVILSQMEECMMGWMMHGIQHVLLKNWKRIQIISSFIGNGRSKKIHSH